MPCISCSSMILFSSGRQPPGWNITFKHALTHEVIYESILQQTRKGLHERIGQVMERLYADRINEFCETLAFHFTRAGSSYKAVKYHLQSGEKATQKYALEEADRHYEQAFLILENKADKSTLDIQLLVDVLNHWGHVFYLLENNRKLIELFKRKEKTVAAAVDKNRQAMFYSWLGLACREREKLKDAHRYLTTAIRLGEESSNRRAVGFATAWLSFAAADMGLLELAIEHSSRALAISQELDSQAIYRESMYGLAKGHLYRGDWKKTLKVGNDLIANGNEKSDSRALAGGNLFVGAGYLSIGDLEAAIDALHQAIEFSPGPTYLLYAKTFLGQCYVSLGKFTEVQGILDEIISFGEKYGLEAAGEAAKALSGAIMMLNGKPAQGLKLLSEITQNWQSIGNQYRYAVGELSLGKFYQQVVNSKQASNPLRLIKNLGFIIRVVPFARKRAEKHLNNAVKQAEQMGARMILGQAYLGLGQLYRAAGDPQKTKDFIARSIRAFEQCEADNFLKQAIDALQRQN